MQGGDSCWTTWSEPLSPWDHQEAGIFRHEMSMEDNVAGKLAVGLTVYDPEMIFSPLSAALTPFLSSASLALPGVRQ